MPPDEPPGCCPRRTAPPIPRRQRRSLARRHSDSAEAGSTATVSQSWPDHPGLDGGGPSRVERSLSGPAAGRSVAVFTFAAGGGVKLKFEAAGRTNEIEV